MQFKGSIKSKLPKSNTSIFAVMTALANEHNAINLAQGFPDFEVSPKLIELVNKYMKLGMNQYAPMPGLLSLREKIAQKTYDLYSAQYDANSEIKEYCYELLRSYRLLVLSKKFKEDHTVNDSGYHVFKGVNAQMATLSNNIFIHLHEHAKKHLK